MQLDMPINGLDVPISGGNQRTVVIVKPFSDDRLDTKRCGMKKNGYNMDTADAICKTTPDEWMTQLLADELRASGFNVSTEKSISNTNALIIEGSVTKLFTEPVIGMWSGSLETDIEVKLTATSASGLFAERVFFAKGIKKGVIVATAGPFLTSLKRATDEILTNMIEAIFYLMNQYPGLGQPDLEVETNESFERWTH
jgi:hypothetical protein